MEFVDFKIKEIAKVTAGGDKPKIVSNSYSDETPIPIYSNGMENDGLYGYTNIPKVDADTVTISARGVNVGKVCYRETAFLPIVRLLSLIPNRSVINAKYMYYNLKMMNISGTGSAQPQIPVPMISELKMHIHKDLIEQEKIASFLSVLDEKIKNNNRINRNLYEQIGTLCEAWLTDYEPFGGVCPEDWIVTPLSDIAEFISGYSYKGKELVEESKVAMATIKNFERKGGFKLDGYKTIEPSDKLKEVQHVELFDTLVAHTDLTQNADVIGNAELVLSKFGYDDIVFSMDLVKVLPKNESISPFLLAALLHSNSFKQHCLGYVNGTTVLHLSKKALPDYKLPLPKDMSQLKTLDRLLEVLYKQIATNIESNIRFEKLRDSLLPMLMSGKLDVSDLNI